MFACMFHRTLHMTVGNPDAKISRHIGAVGTRFRLLSCALTLIQGKCFPYFEVYVTKVFIYLMSAEKH